MAHVLGGQGPDFDQRSPLRSAPLSRWSLSDSPFDPTLAGREEGGGGGGGASAESDAWLKGILAETQQLISSVKSEQVALTAEADRLQGQLWSASGFNKGSVSEAAQQQLPPRLGGKREQT